MKVKIKKTHHNAVVPFKTYEKDFCYDCVATSCEEVAPNVYKYGLGISAEIVRPEMFKDDKRFIVRKKNNKKKKDKSRDAHQAITYVKKHFEMPLGFIVHHWNYNHIYDVFIIDRRSHAIIHHKITFDKESRCFLYNGELLDTKEKHEMAIRKILGLTNEEQIIKFKKE